MIEALNNKSIAHFPYAQFERMYSHLPPRRRVIGYDVLYTIDGTPGKVRTTFKPGDIIALDSDGRLVLEQEPYCSMNENIPCRKRVTVFFLALTLITDKIKRPNIYYVRPFAFYYLNRQCVYFVFTKSGEHIVDKSEVVFLDRLGLS